MSETTAEPLRGAELLRAAVNRILDHPEQWNQSQWHCGTKHCVFGWCQVLAGRPQSDETCFDEVKDLLGISDADAMWLSAPNRTLGEIHGYAAALLVGGDGYNRDGYNRDGYDRAGYNRDGYNRDGRDRAGRDRDGNMLPRL